MRFSSSLASLRSAKSSWLMPGWIGCRVFPDDHTERLSQSGACRHRHASPLDCFRQTRFRVYRMGVLWCRTISDRSAIIPPCDRVTSSRKGWLEALRDRDAHLRLHTVPRWRRGPAPRGSARDGLRKSKLGTVSLAEA